MNTLRSCLPWLGSLLSGVFVVVAFEPVGWWWCGWIALAPAWVALRASVAVRESPLRYGYLVGLMFILGGFWWVGAVTLIGIAIMAVVLSFYPALWFLFAARLLQRAGGSGPLPPRKLAVFALLVAAFWVTLEWLRGWFMKGFNWNELGVSQVPSEHFRQLASLGGVPFVTLVLVTTSILVGETIWSLSQRWWRAAGVAFLGGIVLVGACWLYGFQHLRRHLGETPQASLSYACVQPDIPELPYYSGQKEEIHQLEIKAMTKQQEISARAIVAQPDLLIWPEAITTQRLVPGSLLSQVVDHIEAYYIGSILLGAEEVDQGKLYNTAYLFPPGHAPVQRYHKVYLVVLGEYLPWTNIFPWLTQWWGRGISATAGLEPGRLTLTRNHLSLAPLMCFEDTQPLVVSAAAARRPDFFVTLINAGWFNGPLARWCLRQHLENATLRCVEHDRPMIRCADTGITCEIDANGRVTAELPAETGPPGEVEGILNRRLIIYPWLPTLFDRWGDWVGWLTHFATLAACLIYLTESVIRSIKGKNAN